MMVDDCSEGEIVGVEKVLHDDLTRKRAVGHLSLNDGARCYLVGRPNDVTFGVRSNGVAHAKDALGACHGERLLKECMSMALAVDDAEDSGSEAR